MASIMASHRDDFNNDHYIPGMLDDENEIDHRVINRLDSNNTKEESKNVLITPFFTGGFS